MTKTKTLENAFLTFLIAAFTSLAVLLVASPAIAAPREQAVKERMAQLCTASDVDLVGKRLARNCRKQVRADTTRVAGTVAPVKAKLAVR